MAKLSDLLKDEKFTSAVDRGRHDLLEVAAELAKAKQMIELSGYQMGLLVAAFELCFAHCQEDYAMAKDMLTGHIEGALLLFNAHQDSLKNENNVNKPTGPKKPILN